MEMFWPHWQRPLWLLLLPLLSWLLWQLWHRQKRSGRWQLLLPAAFQSVLLSNGRTRTSKLPWIVLGLAWLLALLALLGPSWQRQEQASQKRADPLVVILELTPAMLATDTPPNRLEQARRKLIDLLRARSDAQTAIIVYAGSAHVLVPLSDDFATARNLLESVRPSIMPEPGQRADLAIARAQALLEHGAQGRGRLLLITSSLSEQERSGIHSTLGNHGQRLALLGVGTTQGAPIRDEDGSLLKDAKGAILVPRLDNIGLHQFAKQLGGSYRTLRLDDSDLKGLNLLNGPEQLREDGEPTQLAAWADQSHWLLLPLLLIAACAGRRGWLFCLPLLLYLAPQPGYALGWDDLWLRADQQGQRLLQENHPKAAAERFEDPQWQGEALYRAGDYAGAIERFTLDTSATGHYNRGNALARSNELEAALDAYDQALELAPDLLAAQQNKALVEQLLQQQKQQAPQQEQKQEADPAEQQGQPQQQQPSNEQTTQNDSDTGSPQSPSTQDEPPSPRQPEPQTAQVDQQDGNPPSDTNTYPGNAEPLDGEQRDALEQWLRQIPDDPGELLRRKFLYEQQQRQEHLQ